MRIFQYQKHDIEENRIELYYNQIDQETEIIMNFLGLYK